MGSLKHLYYISDIDLAIQLKQRHSGNMYRSIELPSLYKLKRADYYISAQDTSSDATLAKPVKIKVDEVSLFPIEQDAFEWCSHHFPNNPYLADIRQLYFHMIPDKDSFTIAHDNLILQYFTWKQWRELLAEKDSNSPIRQDLYDDCKALVASFEASLET